MTEEITKDQYGRVLVIKRYRDGVLYETEELGYKYDNPNSVLKSQKIITNYDTNKRQFVYYGDGYNPAWVETTDLSTGQTYIVDKEKPKYTITTPTGEQIKTNNPQTVKTYLKEQPTEKIKAQQPKSNYVVSYQGKNYPTSSAGFEPREYREDKKAYMEQVRAFVGVPQNYNTSRNINASLVSSENPFSPAPQVQQKETTYYGIERGGTAKTVKEAAYTAETAARSGESAGFVLEPESFSRVEKWEQPTSLRGKLEAKIDLLGGKSERMTEKGEAKQNLKLIALGTAGAFTAGAVKGSLDVITLPYDAYKFTSKAISNPALASAEVYSAVSRPMEIGGRIGENLKKNTAGLVGEVFGNVATGTAIFNAPKIISKTKNLLASNAIEVKSVNFGETVRKVTDKKILDVGRADIAFKAGKREFNVEALSSSKYPTVVEQNILEGKQSFSYTRSSEIGLSISEMGSKTKINSGVKIRSLGIVTEAGSQEVGIYKQVISGRGNTYNLVGGKQFGLSNVIYEEGGLIKQKTLSATTQDFNKKVRLADHKLGFGFDVPISQNKPAGVSGGFVKQELQAGKFSYYTNKELGISGKRAAKSFGKEYEEKFYALEGGSFKQKMSDLSGLGIEAPEKNAFKKMMESKRAGTGRDTFKRSEGIKEFKGQKVEMPKSSLNIEVLNYAKSAIKTRITQKTPSKIKTFGFISPEVTGVSSTETRKLSSLKSPLGDQKTGNKGALSSAFENRIIPTNTPTSSLKSDLSGKYAQKLKPVTITTTTTTNKLKTPFIPSFITPPTPTLTPPLLLSASSIGGGGSDYSFIRKTRAKRKYTPTLFSTITRTKRKLSEKDVFFESKTGLTIRPMRL